MAKQTFVTGNVLTAAQMNTLQANDYNATVSTKIASYVLVAADVGTTIVQNVATANTVTVNTALFAAGDTLRIQNIGAGIATITAGTATVNTAGSLALPQWGSGILYFTSASAAIFFPSAAAAVTSVIRSANIGATFTTTSASFVDQTGYTLTFTPASATNKINISVDFMFEVNTTGANVEWQILRGSTVLFYRASSDNVGPGKYQNLHFEVTDTNAPASSHIYKLQVRINGGFTYSNYNDTVGFTGSQIRTLEVY